MQTQLSEPLLPTSPQTLYSTMPRAVQRGPQLSVTSGTSSDVDDEDFEAAVAEREDENDIEDAVAPLDELPLNPDKDDYRRVRVISFKLLFYLLIHTPAS